MRVKLCGLRRNEEVEHAAALSAWAVGLNFCPDSPRYLSLEQALQLPRPPQLWRVGVFTTLDAAEVARYAQALALDAIQLHHPHNAPVADFLALGLPLLYALSRPEQLSAELDAVFALVIDAAPSLDGALGGTGRLADWSWAAELAHQRRVVLAGGLSADNVQPAIKAVSPWAVDVASGIESSRGIKDLDKMTQFMHQARNGMK